MTLADVQTLLKQYEKEQLRDRRSVRRKPFVRPVVVAAGRDRDELHEAFSRDISHIGIGIIGRTQWAENTFARLIIHSPDTRPITVEAQVRWVESYGNDWFVSGWSFLDR